MIARQRRWRHAPSATAVIAILCLAVLGTKTSTGFHPAGGATAADVRLLRAAVGADFGVKASGGIRSLAYVRAMLDAGANRIGTSASAAILADAAI